MRYGNFVLATNVPSKESTLMKTDSFAIYLQYLFWFCFPHISSFLLEVAVTTYQDFNTEVSSPLPFPNYLFKMYSYIEYSAAQTFSNTDYMDVIPLICDILYSMPHDRPVM